MAIGTLGQLKTAIAAWTDQGSDLDAYMDDFVRLTTDAFNFGTDGMAPLRLREMILVDMLTPVAGICELPADYLQYRRVVQLASVRRELQHIAPSVADQRYADRSGGVARDFTIVGNSLQAFPVGDTDIELTYYQRIPQMAASGDTNWLLTLHPTLYLHGGILQVGLFRRNDDLITRSVAFLTSYVAGLRAAGEIGENARPTTRMRGFVA